MEHEGGAMGGGIAVQDPLILNTPIGEQTILPYMLVKTLNCRVTPMTTYIKS